MMSEKIVVLIVEDEALLRMDAADIIADAGYEVLEAVSADEAIELLEMRPDIRIVFTDIEMPGSMNGMKLAHAVRDRWPPVLIIVASGRVSPQFGELPDDVHFMRKPYRPREIIAALEQAA